MSPDILEVLKYGALAISAFCLFLSFFLIRQGSRPTSQIFGFMFFGLLVLLVSVIADPNAGIERYFSDGDLEPVDPIEITAENVVGTGFEVRTWDSGWFSVQQGQEYLLHHETGEMPLVASIWYRKEGSNEMHLMDGIFEGLGYGAWVNNVNERTLKVSTGPGSATSGYGLTSHWSLIDQGAGQNSAARQLRVVLLY